MKALILRTPHGSRISLAALLRELGHGVDEATNMREITERLEHGRYDLLLVELPLRDLASLALIYALRKVAPQIPLLAHCSKNDACDRVALLDAGCDDVLDAALEFEELLARLRAQLRRARPTGEELLTNGVIRLYSQQRRVFVSGAPIELTYKELAVLGHLLRKCGEVVSRSELMFSIWERRDSTATNLLDVYVSRLRLKLREAGRCLATVRGIGYRLSHA